MRPGFAGLGGRSARSGAFQASTAITIPPAGLPADADHGFHCEAGLTRFLAPLLPPPLLVATTVDVTHSIDMLGNASYAVTSWLSASADVTDS